MTTEQIKKTVSELSSKKVYSREDAILVKQAYNHIFDLLLETHSREYLQIEKKLNRLQIRVQVALGEYVRNPCPAQFVGYCEFCTGWYKKKPNRSSREVKHEMCSGTEENKIKCLFFEYSQGSKEAK